MRWLELAPRIRRLKPGLEKSCFRFSSNPVLGYEFKENYRDESPDRLLSYTYINADGCRDIERSCEKPDGVKRIIVLGDSVTAGADCIDDLNQTIPRKLEELLKPLSIEVLNFGIDGYCTRGEVERLRTKGLKYDPDLVILIFVDNDYYDYNSEIDLVSHDRPKTVEWLFIYSHLFRVSSLQLNLFDMRLQFGMNAFLGETSGELYEFMSPEHIDKVMAHPERDDCRTWRDHLLSMEGNNVDSGLQMLRKLSEEHGFEVVVGIWPRLSEDGILDANKDYLIDQWYEYEIGDPRALTVELLAQKHGFRSFRFSGFFHEDYTRKKKAGELRGQDPCSYYTCGDCMHPNVTGAAVAAEVLRSLVVDDLAFHVR